MSERYARLGQVWVCAACGRTQPFDRYGIDKPLGSRGWDESCMLNSVLCHDKQHIAKDGQLRWFKADEPLPEYVRVAPEKAL